MTAVKAAWDEVTLMADAHSQWESPGWFSLGAMYEAAMDTYIGTDSNKNKPYFSGTRLLKSKVLRQGGIHLNDEYWSPSCSYGYLYCSVADVPKKAKFKNLHLCPGFLEDEITTLDPDMQKTMSDLWRRINHGVVIHESYRWDPRCDGEPEVYDPSKAMKLGNSKGARINGETSSPHFSKQISSLLFLFIFSRTFCLPLYSQSDIQLLSCHSNPAAEWWNQGTMAIYLRQTFRLSSPPKLASLDVTYENENFAPPVVAIALTKDAGQQPEPNPPVPEGRPETGDYRSEPASREEVR